MIKNQLYPYIEKYFNELLYGFTKEQFDIGVMNGEVKLEKLNFRPDGVNKILDDKNRSFWLKAGFIGKIYIGCSIMNFIGEKPLEVLIEDIDIILTPSYKWIIKNLDSFFYENNEQIKLKYDSNENNSMNIFERKVNIVDNSVFKNEIILEIFKDGTKISQLINNLYKYCYKFYYMSNFLIKAKLKNIHIRFEDDQLINYTGNIAMGIKIESADLILSSEGVMKKDSMKINNLNIYWECNAKILIPSELLNNSFVNGELSEKYYENIKKLNFHNFNYSEDTKFIVQNFNCIIKLGTLAISSGKVDIFGKRNNQYKMYIQFSSNELNINIFPELIDIYNNFKKFMQEFSIIEQVQDFKPMKKPYNSNNIIVKNILKKKNDKKMLSLFLYKKKMTVRDWLYYFYWCQKCKSSIYGKSINPIRLEFNRFYGQLFNQWEDLNQNKLNENEKKEKENELNPDNINLFLSFIFSFKGININIHSSIKDLSKKYISLKIIGVESKLNSSQNLFDLNLNIKNISIFPNKLIIGENIIINSNKRKVIEQNNNYNSNIKYERNDYVNMYNNEEDNSGLFGLIRKYNPNYEKRVKMIDNVLDKIESESRAESRAMSEIDMKEFAPKFKQIRKIPENNNIENKKKEIIRPSFFNINNKENNKNNSFVNKIISNYEGSPIVQKMELTKQKKEFSISQAINEYNTRKTHERKSLRQGGNKSSQITGVLYLKSQNNKNFSDITYTGKNVPLNFIEISSNDNANCFSFKYTKNNLDKMIDHILIRLGTIRCNIFQEYIYDYLYILSKYKSFINQPIINSIKKIEFDIKSQKELYKMQKYIYDYITKNPQKKSEEQIKEYKKYLKNELIKSKLLGFDSDSFEINYLINFFSKGFDIDINYESIEFIQYGNNKKFCGKGIIPSSQFHLIIEPNYFKFKFFDFECELNDLENTKMIISKTMKIFEEKLKETKLFIEPCISKLREELNNKKNEGEDKENKKLENILSIVKENFANKENIKKKEENIKQKKFQNKNSTFREDIDDENFDDLNLDDSFKHKKIKIKQTTIPNHFYSETFFKSNNKNDNDEEKYNNIKMIESSDIGNKNKINLKKNNLPMVNKK